MKTNSKIIRRAGAVTLAVSLAVLNGCAHAEPSYQEITALRTPLPATGRAQPAPPATSAVPAVAAGLQTVVDEAYAKFKDDTAGKNADYIPYLASVPSNLFAVVIVTADGQAFSAGDVNYAFSIQSCSKVFTLC